MMDHAVVELVRRWAEVELNGEVDAYPDILATDFLGVGPVGFVLDAEQWAERHRTGLTNHELTVTDERVRFFSGTAIVDAVLRQRTTARGHDSSGSFRIVVVAVRQKAQWRIANIQFSGPLLAPGERPAFHKDAENAT